MYSLPYFKEPDAQAILPFMQQYPFAFVSGCNAAAQPVATQIPLFAAERQGKLFLWGHLMRQTDHHKAFMQNPNVLCVFTGPHCYVSASWYTNPHQASTWNYMSVHAKGRIRFLDEQALVDVLRKTSLYFENNNTDSPTYFNNLSQEYTERLMKAIVAFEIEVQDIDHVFKLSQNHNRENYENIIRHLWAGSAEDQAVARAMEERKERLFAGTASQ